MAALNIADLAQLRTDANELLQKYSSYTTSPSPIRTGTQVYISAPPRVPEIYASEEIHALRTRLAAFLPRRALPPVQIEKVNSPADAVVAIRGIIATVDAFLPTAGVPQPIVAVPPTQSASANPPLVRVRKNKPTPVRCRNEERDAWVAKQRAKKSPLTWAEIFDDASRLAAKKGWDMPGSPDALSEAYRKYLERKRRNPPKS